MTEWTMDRWKDFDVTHRQHVVCNPMRLAKLDDLLALCALPEVAHLADIACGKGEARVRPVERFGVSGIGVDVFSPYAVADAQWRSHRASLIRHIPP